jgi:transcription initiation factor IIE alpha subunit
MEKQLAFDGFVGRSAPPPAQWHSPTSIAAAASMLGAAAHSRRRVYTLLLARGPLTDEEMQERLGMNPSTQRPRRIELVHAGLVRDSDQRRKTRSGRWAIVWTAAVSR